MTESTAFEGWAVLELMGHRKLAGFVREVTVAGAGFLRLDVPGDGADAVTQFYPPSSVYCLTPTSEEIARGLAKNMRPTPVHRFELPAPREPVTDGEVFEADDDAIDDDGRPF